MTSVRVSLTEEELARLVELLDGVEDPVNYKLRAKLLTHQGKQLQVAAAVRSPKRSR